MAHDLRIAVEHLPRIGMVDDRFQSYNIEMVEVIGGRFWKPYGEHAEDASKRERPASPSAADPVGTDPALYQYRPPIDLTDPRLRKLGAALGPAYLRVSGTWANTVYFHDVDDDVPESPPDGFGGVLTRAQWKGVVDFSHSVDARIVSSVAISAGTRDAYGVWTSDQARRLLDYTTSIGGRIAATEFMNEPTYARMGGAPNAYDAADFGRDIAVFQAFLRRAAPDALFLGPGSVGEGMNASMAPQIGMLRSEDLLAAAGPVFDVFSYHFYGAVSLRGASFGGQGATAAAALSDDWLSRTDTVEAFYAGLRDGFEPGRPLWITETAESAAGGNPWASSFVDSFRYLYQLGSLARRGVQVIAHNTLASSDYGLLDEESYAPRPNYWAALLWRRLMGTAVLDPGPSPSSNLHLYAMSMRDKPGGVTVLAINADRDASHSIELASGAERYTLSAPDLLRGRVDLNGVELTLGVDDGLPQLIGEPQSSGPIVFEPTTITFLAIPDAQNAHCL